MYLYMAFYLVVNDIEYTKIEQSSIKDKSSTVFLKKIG